MNDEHMTFFLHNDIEYLVLCKAKSSFRCRLALLHAFKKGHNDSYWILTIHEREFADDDDEISEADSVVSVRVTSDDSCLYSPVYWKTYNNRRLWLNF